MRLWPRGAPGTRASAASGDTANAKPRIVLDGTDGVEGRALLMVSAMYHAAAALADWQIDFVHAHDAVVQAAIAALRWDTGMDANVLSPQQTRTAFCGAHLYAAVCFRDSAHLDLAAAARLEVPTLIAIQFPQVAHGAPVLALQRAAHDPAVLGAALLARLDIG